MLEACRDAFGPRFPIISATFSPTGRRRAACRTASGLHGPDPGCVVSMIGCTGDWFGGWDGISTEAGRPVHHGRPEARAAEGSHRAGRASRSGLSLAGDVFNGRERLHDLQGTVRRLHEAYDHLVWMKLSEIGESDRGNALSTACGMYGTRFHLQCIKTLDVKPARSKYKYERLCPKCLSTTKDTNSCSKPLMPHEGAWSDAVLLARIVVR